MSATITDLILRHKGCTKFVCTTCGGLIGFRNRISDLIEKDLDINKLLCKLDPFSITTIENWDVYLRQLMIASNFSALKDNLYDAWKVHLGKIPDFDLFFLSCFETDHRYVPEVDAVWIDKCAGYVISREDVDGCKQLLGFLGTDKYLYPELEDLAREADRKEQTQKEFIARQKQRRAERIREEKEARETHLALFDDMAPIERVLTIATNRENPPSYYPEGWAIIQTENIRRLSRDEKSKLISYLNRKKKGPWKELRIQIRNIMQQERSEERTLLIEQLEFLTQEERIIYIAMDQDHPIDFYPIEFTLVDDEILKGLSDDIKINIFNKTRTSNSREWKELSNKISPRC